MKGTTTTSTWREPTYTPPPPSTLKIYQLRQSIRNVIESCFSETKEEIQNRALNLIMELIG